MKAKDKKSEPENVGQNPKFDLFKTRRQLLFTCFLLLVLCAAFSLSYPLAFRTASGQLFVGSQSYAVLLQTQHTLMDLSNPQKYLFSASTAPVPFSAVQYIYTSLFSLFPPWALPAILSFCLISLAWFALLRFDVPLSTKFITACMFIFSPLFVSSQLSLGSAAFCFIGITLLFIALRNHWPPWACLIISIFVGMLGLDIAFVFVLTLVFSREREGFAPLHNQKRFAAIGGCIGLIIWFLGALITKMSLHALIVAQSPDRMFIEFGSMHGQTILLFILAIIGIAVSWKKEYRWQVVAACALVAWSIFFPATNLLAAAAISYFAAVAFVRIARAKWQHSSLKIIVLAVILIAVLTGYFVYAHQIIDASPARQDLAAYTFIDQNTKSDAVFFASPQQGPYVAYFAHRESFISDQTASAEYDGRFQEYQQVLYTRQLAIVIDQLKSHNVTHILVDPQLASTDLWQEDRGGLALLLRNRRVFAPIYDQDNYRIYEINYVEAKKEITS